MSKAPLITSLCGLGYIFGSILLGLAVVAMMVAVERFEFVESTRGTVTAWLLIAFGLAYSCGA